MILRDSTFSLFNTFVDNMNGEKILHQHDGVATKRKSLSKDLVLREGTFYPVWLHDHIPFLAFWFVERHVHKL